MKNGALESFTEMKEHANDEEAYDYFLRLCDKYLPGPYYYLCNWKRIYK